MELTENEIIQNYGNNADVPLKTLFFHKNMNLIAFRVDITYLNKNTTSLKYNGKKLILLIA